MVRYIVSIRHFLTLYSVNKTLFEAIWCHLRDFLTLYCVTKTLFDTFCSQRAPSRALMEPTRFGKAWCRSWNFISFARARPPSSTWPSATGAPEVGAGRKARGAHKGLQWCAI